MRDIFMASAMMPTLIFRHFLRFHIITPRRPFFI